MKNHTKIYLKAFGYSGEDFIPSEISGNRAVDIHHIECKGSGGNPLGDKDRIENLMAVTRDEHVEYGDKKQYMKYLFETHYSFLKANGVKFDEKYMIEKIEYYERQ